MESSYRKGVHMIGPAYTDVSDEQWNKAFPNEKREKKRVLRRTMQKACPSCANDLLIEYVDSMNAVTIACVSSRCNVQQSVPRSAQVPPHELFDAVMNEVFANIVRRMQEEGRCPLCAGAVEVRTVADGDTESGTCLQCGYTASYNNGTSVVTVDDGAEEAHG